MSEPRRLTAEKLADLQEYYAIAHPEGHVRSLLSHIAALDAELVTAVEHINTLIADRHWIASSSPWRTSIINKDVDAARRWLESYEQRKA